MNILAASWNFRGSFLGAIIGTALSTGCSPSKFDATAESARLLAVDAEWSAVAYAGKDVARIISYWSDDATIYARHAHQHGPRHDQKSE